MNKLKELWFVLTNPTYWHMSKSYNEGLDYWCRKNIHNYFFTNTTDYYASLGPVRFWIENHPYASFTIKGVRPSRYMIYQLHSKYVNECILGVINDTTE